MLFTLKGACSQPSPQLIGREDLLEQLRVSIERLRIGKPAKSLVIIGLRGVGKTLLLNQMLRNAEALVFTQSMQNHRRDGHCLHCWLPNYGQFCCA